MNCAIHPEKPGTNLCINCGNWYCDTCMDFSNGQPICKRCKFGQQNSVNFINPISLIQNLVINLPREWRLVFTVTYFVIFGLLLGFSIYLTLRYRVIIMYIPTAIYLLSGFVFYILFIKNKIYSTRKKYK
jgi:hypothetical protein